MFSFGGWVYRVFVLVSFCFIGCGFYVYRDSFTVDQFGWFMCFGWVIAGVMVFVYDVMFGLYGDVVKWRLLVADSWRDKWLERGRIIEDMELDRCSKGRVVREWDGYFLQSIGGAGVIDLETYALFRVEPYGRVEVFVGGLTWALGECEKVIAKDRGEFDIREVAMKNAAKLIVNNPSGVDGL